MDTPAGPPNIASTQPKQRELRNTVPSDVLDAKEAGLWKHVGAGPLHLVSQPNVVTRYLGFDERTVKYGAFDSNSNFLILTAFLL